MKSLDGDLRSAAIVMAVGLVPFTLAGGWSSIGDMSWLPWALGFATQVAFVAGMLAWRRWKNHRIDRP